jgi:hypothetical protein
MKSSDDYLNQGNKTITGADYVCAHRLAGVGLCKNKLDK